MAIGFLLQFSLAYMIPKCHPRRNVWMFGIIFNTKMAVLTHFLTFKRCLSHEGGAAHGDRSGACGTNQSRMLIGSHTLIDTRNEGRVVCRWDYHTVLLGYIFWHISQYGMSLWLRNPQRMQHHELGELHGHRTCRRPW